MWRLIQILRGLDHLFQNGVCHRDIKEDNILCGADGRMVVADLGHCLDVRPEGESWTFRYHRDMARGGNRSHMAPEILHAKVGTLLDYRACDVFAAGCLGYALFGSPHPFLVDGGGRQAPRAYRAQELPQLAPIEGVPVPREVSDVLRACILRDPSFRPTLGNAAQALVALLFCRGAGASDDVDVAERWLGEQRERVWRRISADDNRRFNPFDVDDAEALFIMGATGRDVVSTEDILRGVLRLPNRSEEVPLGPS